MRQVAPDMARLGLTRALLATTRSRLSPPFSDRNSVYRAAQTSPADTSSHSKLLPYASANIMPYAAMAGALASINLDSVTVATIGMSCVT